MTTLTNKFFSTSKIYNSQDAIDIMDFLTSADSVDRMIIMADLGLPSLSGVVRELEAQFGNSKNFPLNHKGEGQNATNRQNIGRMIKFIMREFGYSPVESGLSERARLRDFANSKYFSTAAIYAKTHIKPNYVIERTIK
ncbi:MAG TPA: hypothetical protein VFC84_13625 [Desulfosporosinus sp.]|nr:hypothetical protein [Desulfosporosinus sp.]